MKFLISTAVALAFATPVFAQDATMIEIAESEKFGQYLTDADGRPVYLFTTDTPGTADEETRISCTSAECLGAWPLVTTSGDPKSGDGADAALLGTACEPWKSCAACQSWR